MKEAEEPTQFLETVDLLRKRLEQLQEEIPEAVDDYHRLFLYFVGDILKAFLRKRSKFAIEKEIRKLISMMLVKTALWCTSVNYLS